MAALAPGTVSSTSRFHFRSEVRRAENQDPPEPGGVGGGGADEGLARSHFAHHGGAPMGLEGQGRALDGVLLASHRGPEQPGQPDWPFFEGR